jgi:outer membrane protein
MRYYSIVIGILLIAVSCVPLYADSAPDTLTLQQAIQLAVGTNPQVQLAKERIHAYEELIGVARSGNYPNLTALATYSHLAPVPEVTIPGESPIALYPKNNYDLSLNLTQMIYDFGRVSAQTAYARSSVQAASDSLGITQWSLAYRTASSFYLILILRQSLSVLQEQIDVLNEHLDISRKRVETGSATKLDTLTTLVRIAATRDQLIDTQNALHTQEIAFRQLLGLPTDQPITLAGGFDTTSVSLNQDSLLQAAFTQRPEYITAKDAEASAILREHLVGLGNKPHLGLSLTGGFMNGYFPNLNRLKGNYVVAAQAQAPIFDGFRTRHEKDAVAAGLAALRARNKDLERRITTEVLQALNMAKASRSKIANSLIQIARAEEAVDMGQTQYSAGVITNLELLDAQTSLSEAKLIHLKALYDYVTSLVALDRVTGRKIW